MKTIVCLGFVVLFLALAQSQPVLDETQEVQLTDVDTPDTLVDATSELNLRQKRATCDLLSAFNVNHSACAVHCISRRYKGGYCSDKAVCVCRR
ncbi:defensin [Drosophila albomicans]|uniref:Defensin n=1 Tax=Drosophila albomicans TaxID=7291 RepID=A0A6P8WXA3_DROAB|nr:defensin [Drosophila albomicans]